MTFFTGWIALGTGTTTFTEMTGTSYARVALDVDNNSRTTTTATSLFTAGGSWDPATQGGLFDAVTDGNLLFWWTLDKPFSLTSGKTHSISTGDIYLNNAHSVMPTDTVVGTILTDEGFQPITSGISLIVFGNHVTAYAPPGQSVTGPQGIQGVAGPTGPTGPGPVVTSITGLTASGSTRTDALGLTRINNVVGTATAGTGVILPASSSIGVGNFVTVYNNGASAINVFAAGSDTIDGIAGTTGVVLTNTSRCRYTLLSTGAWVSSLMGATST